MNWGLEQPGALVWLLLQANWTVVLRFWRRSVIAHGGFAAVNRLDHLLLLHCGAGTGMVGALLLLVWAA